MVLVSKPFNSKTIVNNTILCTHLWSWCSDSSVRNTLCIIFGYCFQTLFKNDNNITMFNGFFYIPSILSPELLK